MAERGVLCPECKINVKYYYSKTCMDCWLKKQVKNANSRWMKAKSSDPNYGKEICPRCRENYKSKHGKMCLACLRKEQRAGREGPQFCNRCGVELTDKNWYNHRKKWWHRICDTCYDGKKKAILKNPAERKKRIQKGIRYRVDLKLEMIQAYGSKCQCCGERESAFLTIDHKDGRGKEHRIKTSSGSYRLSGDVLYRWLKKHNWPKDNFQLLCMNCNFAKSHNPGGCPHQPKKQKAKAAKQPAKEKVKA